MSVGNTKRGRHGYTQSDLGLWATTCPDQCLITPPKQTNKHLKIDSGSKRRMQEQKSNLSYQDPVDFLLSLEKKNTRKGTFNTASKIPLQAANSPSLRKIGTLERQKWQQQQSWEASQKPIQHAHSDETGYERTALGLFATLPKKDNGPEFS